ncbi:MAG: AAA family ATPase [Ilumatobacteraceae bacterium]
MFGSDAEIGLLGRDQERDLFERLLDDVRAGRSRVLVLRGEAGVGKTALLDHVAVRASGCRVLRATGAESELPLAFAGLHQISAPMLEHVALLPVPQRDALRSVLGLIATDAVDRFLVGVATLSLLAHAADEQPLVCLVDDAQWLDHASAQVLAFVSRRLLAERVALVFAVREPSNATELDGLPSRTVGGLSNDAARAVLERASPGRLDEDVRDRIVSETRGNPLALLELPRAFTAAELAGGFAMPTVGSLANHIEESFVRRVRSLPTETRQLLLLAAAEPLGDVELVRRAAARLAIDPEAGRPAEADELIELGARVRFRHPLVRSAAYRLGSTVDRRSVHRALADVTDPDQDPDRRAWHRAHATGEPDEDVAADLERSAARALLRGGVAAAAAFLERAAALTPDPARRAGRALAAAQAKYEAADLDAAEALLVAAERGPLEGLGHARIARLRAQIVFARSRSSDAPPLFLEAARRLESVDGRLARDAYLEALGAAMFAGRLCPDPGERGIAEAARRTVTGPVPAHPTAQLLEAISVRLTDGYAAAVPSLRRALDAFRASAERPDEDVARWLWMACPVAPDPVAPELWDDEAWHDLASRAVRFGREAGALGILPVALSTRAAVHVFNGELSVAASLIDEADRITASTGRLPMRYTSLLLLAWRGDEVRATTGISAAMRDATARGEGRAIGLIGYATAVLNNGLGRYEHALRGAEAACEHDDIGLLGWSLAEAVEAAVRSGRPALAEPALRQLEERATASGTEWALGTLACSRALVSTGDAADDAYRDAIARLNRTRIVVHLARSHLLYGEWLRRGNRRADAREQLRTAHDMFVRMGAEAFAERARRELVATGETARKRVPAVHDALTPQEAQVARLASEGRTNPEIGGELFISPRTVEYHLSKVFMKLGVRTRRELPLAMGHVER